MQVAKLVLKLYHAQKVFRFNTMDLLESLNDISESFFRLREFNTADKDFAET